MSLSFVLDNSVVMRWCFDDDLNDYAETGLQNYFQPCSHRSTLVSSDQGIIKLRLV